MTSQTARPMTIILPSNAHPVPPSELIHQGIDKLLHDIFHQKYIAYIL